MAVLHVNDYTFMLILNNHKCSFDLFYVYYFIWNDGK